VRRLSCLHNAVRFMPLHSPLFSQIGRRLYKVLCGLSGGGTNPETRSLTACVLAGGHVTTDPRWNYLCSA
jgi:hypothetical protein